MIIYLSIYLYIYYLSIYISVYLPIRGRKAIIQGSWLQTVFNEGDILHIDGTFNNDVVVISDKAGNAVLHLRGGAVEINALFSRCSLSSTKQATY